MSESSSTPHTSGSPFPSPTLAEDILNTIETLVCVVNGEGDMVYVSPAVKRILGYEVAEVLGGGWWEKVYSKDLELGQAVRARVRRSARGDTPIYPDPHTVRAFAASGEARCLVWRDAKGPGELMIGVGQDITELLQAERMAEQREQEFTAVFQNASDGMLIVNEDWVYEQVNDAACRIFALTREEVVGKAFGSVLPANIDFLELRERALRSGSARVEASFKDRNGESRELELSVTSYFRPGHHLVVQHDVTEQRKLQAQLSQAHRLEAVGRLAGGVAHDFNNMLTAIRGYADLLQRSVTEDKHKRYTEAIQGAATRAAAMTQHLLAFSRKQMLKPQVIEMNQAVTDTVGLLQRLIGEDINLVLLLSSEAGKILVDPAQFGQVLMNLAVNSRDAMQNGGKLIIETQTVQVHEQHVEKQVHVPPGHYALLAITDTGSGIPPRHHVTYFRAILHDQTIGQGNRTRPCNRIRYSDPERRVYLRSQRTGTGNYFQNLLPLPGQGERAGSGGEESDDSGDRR